MQIGHKIDFLFVCPSSNIQAPSNFVVFFYNTSYANMQ